MPETDDSLGDRIFNKTVEAANNAETDEERKKIYNESAKNNLAVTGMSLMGIPMLNEFATYGLLGGGLRVGSGLAGSKVGEYAFGKAGDYGDKKLNTNFLGTTGRILGGFAGYGAGRTGMDLGIKSISGVERLASRGNFTVYNPDYYKGRQREVAKDIITGRDDA